MSRFDDHPCIQCNVEINALQDKVEELKSRLRIAHEVFSNTKRERDCLTADDWRHKAEHYEYEWSCCSAFANRRIGELKAKLEAAELGHARYEFVRKLNAKQFADIFSKNIVSGVPFDELVDAAIAKGK